MCPNPNKRLHLNDHTEHFRLTHIQFSHGQRPDTCTASVFSFHQGIVWWADCYPISRIVVVNWGLQRGFWFLFVAYFRAHLWSILKGQLLLSLVLLEYKCCRVQIQGTKKFRSDSPGLADFVVGLVEFILHLPDGQVKVFGEIFLL